jgi:hypothetical protein
LHLCYSGERRTLRLHRAAKHAHQVSLSRTIRLTSIAVFSLYCRFQRFRTDDQAKGHGTCLLTDVLFHSTLIPYASSHLLSTLYPVHSPPPSTFAMSIFLPRPSHSFYLSFLFFLPLLLHTPCPVGHTCRTWRTSPTTSITRTTAAGS